jgi:hypothetical protein
MERETKCLQRHSIGHGVISYNILQIKGNKTVYQINRYIMMSRSMVNMIEVRTSIVQK